MSSGVVSAANTLTTSSFGPLVSMTSPSSKHRCVISAARACEPTSTPCIIPRPLTRPPGTRSAIRDKRCPTSALLAAISCRNSLPSQNFCKATRAVTNACAFPRNVPLCSPGFHTSYSGRMSTSAIGSP